MKIDVDFIGGTCLVASVIGVILALSSIGLEYVFPKHFCAANANLSDFFFSGLAILAAISILAKVVR